MAYFILLLLLYVFWFGLLQYSSPSMPPFPHISLQPLFWILDVFSVFHKEIIDQSEHICRRLLSSKKQPGESVIVIWEEMVCEGGIGEAQIFERPPSAGWPCLSTGSMNPYHSADT